MVRFWFGTINWVFNKSEFLHVLGQLDQKFLFQTHGPIATWWKEVKLYSFCSWDVVKKHFQTIVSKMLAGPKILSEFGLKLILVKLIYESWSLCIQAKSNRRLRQIRLYKYKSTDIHINLRWGLWQQSTMFRKHFNVWMLIYDRT